MHWQQGWDKARAARYHQQVAEQALRRYAYREAMAHLTTALELLATLPESPVRAQEELSLQLALGVMLLTIQGHASQEVERTYTRALVLCQQLGETIPHFRVLRGLWNCALTQGKLLASRERGAQLLALALRQGEPELLPLAHRALGTSLFWLGEFAQAWQHLRARRDPGHRPRLPRLYRAVWRGPRPGLSALWGLNTVGPRVPRPGLAADAGGAAPRRNAGASV